jgi:hypothetical protein
MDKHTKHEEIDASEESYPVASLIKINELIHINFTMFSPPDPTNSLSLKLI